MNLKAIKERCEAAKFSSNPAHHVASSEDVPELLAWVERVRSLCSNAKNIPMWVYWRDMDALLAELDDAEIKGKGD